MIRQATLDDLPQLVELWREALQETSYNGLIFAPHKVEKTFIDLISQNCFVCVEERDGVIIGNLTGRMTGEFFTEDDIAVIMGFYVLPKYRGGKKAVYMIWNFIEWAKKNNCKQIRAGISSGNPTANRLYQRMGFSPVGYQYLLGV